LGEPLEERKPKSLKKGFVAFGEDKRRGGELAARKGVNPKRTLTKEGNRRMKGTQINIIETNENHDTPYF